MTRRINDTLRPMIIVPFISFRFGGFFLCHDIVFGVAVGCCAFRVEIVALQSFVQWDKHHYGLFKIGYYTNELFIIL